MPDRPITRAVLFDFDHTLVELGSHVDWGAARRALLPLYEAAGVPAVLIAATPGAIGLYDAVGRSALFDEASVRSLQHEASAMIEAFEGLAIEAAEEPPGMRRMLERFAAAALPMAIVSSNARSVVRAVLDRLALADYFTFLVGRDDVAQIKPSPEGLAAACKALNVPPSAGVFVGDAEADMLAAVAAGLFPVGIATGVSRSEALAAAGAARVVESVSDVAHIILGGDLDQS
jgi:phosphoglycolate phosphatase